MPNRKAIPVILSLLLAAGLGVCASLAEAQAATKKKVSASKSGASSRGAKSSKKKSRRRERGQKAPTPERIAEIQQALAKDGSFAGTPNGKWDGTTVEAMKKFQESHGLNPSGKLDAKTLQQLGLGSQTAGVAAPLPLARSTAVIAPAASVRQQQ